MTRIFSVLLATPIVLALMAGLSVWLTLPPAHTTLRIAGLSAPVDITLDQWGVPRIRAQSETDAAAALGYLHARDRLFQMELTRRAAAGRLAEIAGPRAVTLDRMARILGEKQHADRSYAALPPNLRALFTAYAAGVNAWIAQRGYMAAPEFLALGTPEPWAPQDCLMWGETVSLWLGGNEHEELARAALAGKIPSARLNELWPSTAGTPAPDSTTQPLRQGLLDALPTFPAAFTLPREASNAWAVDGKHSTTGAPIMAGDPHLALGFPSIWYLARIDTPQGTLVGATAPGLPFVIIGRNAHIGWSFTTAGVDTQDVFIEKALPGGMYATPDGPKPFETREEVIHVSGAPDVHLTARATRHGPVISDADPSPPTTGAPQTLSVEMASLQLPSSVAGLYALDHAASVAEAGQAAAQMTAPVQNLTVAGPDGIGLFTTGEVPIRRAGDGTAPVPGEDGAHDWTGFASGVALPHFVNPASGLLENANERTAPPDFPVFLGRDFPGSIRARRIHELFAARTAFSVDDFGAMQADDVSVFAQDLLPVLNKLPRQPGLTGQAQALLAAWDGTMSVDRPEPLIFNAATQLFVAQVIAANHVGEGDITHWDFFAEWLLSPTGNAWCAGDCTASLGQALHDAVEKLAATYGQDPSSWRWGSVHQAVFAHPLLGKLPVIGGFASRSVAVNGDDTTLFRGGSGRLGDFASHHGAAYRGIYDVADLERSRFIVTPGQSGNLASAHAWDLLPLWAQGHTITIPAQAAHVTGTIRLEP